MVKISLEDFEAAFFGTGPTGICIECGELVDSVEPDAKKQRCDACGEYAVYGIEVARDLGRVEIEK